MQISRTRDRLLRPMIGSTALRVRTSVVGRYGRASWELLGYDPEDSRFASFLGGLGQADIDPWFPAVIGTGAGTALKRLASVTKMVVVSDSARHD